MAQPLRLSSRIAARVTMNERLVASETNVKPPQAKRQKISKNTPSTAQSKESISTFTSVAEFDTWLGAHDATATEIWIKIAKQLSGIPSITLDEALDVALCHGWIDGQGRSLDEKFTLRRYTPRRKKSTWSARNKSKCERLILEGRMRERGLAEMRAAQEDGRWDRAYAGPKTMTLPDDVREALLKKGRADLANLIDNMTNAQRYQTLLKVELTVSAEARRKKIEQLVVALETASVH